MSEAGAPRPLVVGLVGAGPWATNVLAPMLAAGPETTLAGVWTPSGASARGLAVAHGAHAFESFEALVAHVDAVAFAVPPGAQAELAGRAARAGRHLLLDKPLAFDVPAAERVVAAVEAAGVVTQLMLTHRYRAATREWLEGARAARPERARLTFLSGAFVRGPYANAWRREYGVLHDLGPHAFDLLEALLGPIEGVMGSGDLRRSVKLAFTHAGGAVSEAELSGVSELPKTVFTIECECETGTLAFDAVAASSESPWAEVRRSFARAVHGGARPAHDAARGLALQRAIARALVALK
ncbi:MAG: Gfo/Idh/MocA family oxidoreductase [Candidatus Eisenbacteria bacterium]|uniref:Gfo/Idh/MocA family oxidoreductase n=1 Tax=Eiseniibacteriota bacterium TaxID=2212470 RepID=A0A933W7H7_UNCEI|nr:Gfo/Idh/MocA family oxidoreductase [Candidatus Eisenbacteria bacterium]